MRVGWNANKKEAHNIIRAVEALPESQRIAAFMIHGRSRLQRYAKLADWEYINEVAAALTHAWEEKYVRDAMRLVHLSARVKDAFKVDQLRRALPVAARLTRATDADADGVVTLNEFCAGFGELLTQASAAASQ